MSGSSDDIRERLTGFLERAADGFRGLDLPSGYALGMERLASQVYEPCVVAIVGRVNSGKSTFINACLGEELAVVGDVETTATINYFSFGEHDPERPVRCHWRTGLVTDERKDFLDSLQTNDLETLKRAEGIAHLEYFFPNPLLKEITLVDTPGVGSVLAEHQSRAAEVIEKSRKLRKRHEKATLELESEADAIIYLTGSSRALAYDRAVLEEFTEATDGKPRVLNALGVVSKTDLQPGILADPAGFSKGIAEQLKDILNTVVPVSAGLEKARLRLLAGGRDGFERLASGLKAIPESQLEIMFSDEEEFREGDFPDCPLSPMGRQAMRGEEPWSAFKVMARTILEDEADIELVARRLGEMSGFETFKKVLERHFLERSHILRSYRIVEDAKKKINDLRFVHLRNLRMRDKENEARLNRFVSFIREREEHSEAARELEDFVRRTLGGERGAEPASELCEELTREVDGLIRELKEDNADFDALHKLEEGREEFSEGEIGELRALFGLYGKDTASRLSLSDAVDFDTQTLLKNAGERQSHWRREIHGLPRGGVRHDISERVHIRYGMLLHDLLQKSRQPNTDSRRESWWG